MRGGLYHRSRASGTRLTSLRQIFGNGQHPRRAATAREHVHRLRPANSRKNFDAVHRRHAFSPTAAVMNGFRGPRSARRKLGMGPPFSRCLQPHRIGALVDVLTVFGDFSGVTISTSCSPAAGWKFGTLCDVILPGNPTCSRGRTCCWTRNQSGQRQSANGSPLPSALLPCG